MKKTLLIAVVFILGFLLGVASESVAQHHPASSVSPVAVGAIKQTTSQPYAMDQQHKKVQANKTPSARSGTTKVRKYKPHAESTSLIPAPVEHKTVKTMNEITGTRTSALQKRVKEQQRAANNLFGIVLYKPNYVLPAYYTARPDQAVYEGNTPDNQKLKNLEFKAQISLLLPVWEHRVYHHPLAINVAYTQLFYWQFYAKSQYFRETDYEPEVFAAYNFHKNWFMNLGVVHQSNGRGGDYERSWNRVYANLLFSGGNWMVSIKPWVLIFKNESSDLHNPHITKYLGNGAILLAYKWGKSELSLMSRNNLQSGFSRGALELDWSYHLWKHFYFYAQAFSGYGQSLIEYNHYTDAYGVGVALNNWI